MYIPNDDYRHLNIYPTTTEILGECGSLKKNIIKGKFNNIHEYLDIHFKLLREDFVACLRKGVQSYRSQEPTKNIDVYENTRIYKERNKYYTECLKIKIPPQKDDSKKFMNGSLLLFTMNNFNSMFMAKVIRRDIENDEAIIELININNNQIRSEYFTMAESVTYFDPYFQVLSVLQTMATDKFPMEKYIIQADTASVYIPRYLLNKSSQNYEIGNYRLPPQMIPKFKENTLNLNPAQFIAFKAALTQEFVVIQGPPGTGKTFLGLKIAKTLIKNSHFWYKNTPMLVISQKNYALDQFLEGLIPITNKLVRVGGQSKSEKLKQYNLNHDNTKDTPTRSSRRLPADHITTMKQALIIGMTTSLAARWKSYLEELKCPIVIVEEAAEVLESHVVASLTTHCQHLILLGDHEQLQPITSDDGVGRKYHLGVSLFERMINNGIQCYKLNIQHRMRPEISNLLKAKIYPFLLDHESVLRRSPILGVDKSVFFLDHRWSEESTNYASKKNSQEADFVVAFARHLVLNGYKAAEIAILSPYAGQLPELEKRAQNWMELEGVKIMSLDAFQGREADIVLLSLVGNDNIGFLYVRNRVCVALSRARNGFYIFGNMEMLAKKSDVWYNVNRCLKQQNSIGQKLSLRCQMHTSVVTKVGCAEDFVQIYDGGCTKKCQTRMCCGHFCRLLCHTKYKGHVCKQQCRKINDVPYVEEYNSVYRNNDAVNYYNQVDYWDDRNVFHVVIGWLRNLIVNGLRRIFNLFS